METIMLGFIIVVLIAAIVYLIFQNINMKRDIAEEINEMSNDIEGIRRKINASSTTITGNENA